MLGELLNLGSKLITGSGNPIVDLATNFVVSKALGGSGKDAAVATLLQQGLGSSGLLSNLIGGKTEQLSESAIPTISGLAGQGVDSGLAKAAVEKAVAQAPQAAAKGISSIQPAKGTLGIAPFLANAGILDPEGKAAGLLNSRIGEALLFGLGSVAVDKLFGKEEEQPEIATRPFGGVEGYTKLNVPRRAANGGYIESQYYPRRNGGIMPHEGSGQKDDVPAMLMAGEFVLKKDAVKGLGNGDLNKGIERAYAMQDQLAAKGRRGA